ncbi:MAG: RNA polymerase sigma factor [Crocinitomicaceae bacterium]|nr:RNA polymerase sigma factor [Crocinitomicaceae bacterium]
MSQSKQDIFLELYEPIHDKFERFCRARVYGNMEHGDLINETLLVAFEKLDTLKSKDAFLGFLFGISVKILSNNHKKLTERHLNPEDKSSYKAPSENNTELDAEIHFLYKALSELSEDQRECLILFEITGFKIKEIANIQNASEDAVKQRLKRGRKRLSEIMTFESELKTGR